MPRLGWILVLGLVPTFARSAPVPSRRICPTVEAAIGAALRVAGHDPGRGKSWQRRLGWSGLLPKLTARMSQSQSEGELLDLRADTPSRLGLSGYLSLRWEVRATWDLSRLLFDARELQVSSRSSGLARERAALVERVVQLYFERVRLLLMAGTPEPAPQAALERQIALQRVTALLDAMTGGLLSLCEEHRRR
jgi:hypothetical protein